MPAEADSELNALIEVIDSERIDVVIAAGLAGNEMLSRHRAALEPLVRAPFNDLNAFQQLANKRASTALADSLGVPHPLTLEAPPGADVKELADAMGFPIVLKSPVDQGTVRYAHNSDQLARILEEFGMDDRYRSPSVYPLAQQYIEGTGHGFYGLGDNGSVCAYYMHRRLHEVPPSGGPSAMAMSFRDPTMRDLGERFFAATKWTGPAMVEFKRSRADGGYYLIEVNPKFWGSLDLSIAAGVDFPYLLYQRLIGEPVPLEVGAYRDDAVFRWLTMDLAYAAAKGDFRGYLRAFGDRRIEDDFDPGDPKPSVALFAAGFGRVARVPAAHLRGRH
jgi:predicted ATP-grasp superfamily ATP-dependent carboligase